MSDVTEAQAKAIFLAGHWEGWRGNQLRRDVQYIDAEKGWNLYVSNGALAKTLSRASQPVDTGVYAELFHKAHEAEDCGQMLECDPRTVMALQNELQALEAQVSTITPPLDSEAVERVRKLVDVHHYREAVEVPLDDLRALLSLDKSVGGEAPKDGSIFYAVVRIPMKWKPYKPTSQQAKQGIKGRWVESNGFGGWNNSQYQPDQWQPLPATKDEGKQS